MKKDIEKTIIINGRNGKKTFKFEMNNHIDEDIPREKALKEICMWIDECSDVDKWFEEPLWELVAPGFRMAFIPPGHSLYRLLNADSIKAVKEGRGNWLIFKGHIKTDDTIKVTHFGPFGWGQYNEFKENLRELKNKFSNMLTNIGISSRTAFLQMSQHEQKKKKEEFTKRVNGDFMALRQSKLSLLESEKARLLEVINVVFGATAEAVEFTEKVTAALAPTAAKICARIVLRELTVVIVREISKELAKITAKSGSKYLVKKITIVGSKTLVKEIPIAGSKYLFKKISIAGSKSLGKKIPIAGAVVGGFFAYQRLCQGDTEGALLELASGAVSCVPAGGTLVSYGVDAIIAAWDLKNALEFHRTRSESFERISRYAQDLLREIARLDSEYEVVRNALENPDFDIADDEGERFFNAIKYLF